jgi:hypothetical protein
MMNIWQAPHLVVTGLTAKTERAALRPWRPFIKRNRGQRLTAGWMEQQPS